eukprot:scaffold52716_cov63-Phaeocystis_antarctica.AAC.2
MDVRRTRTSLGLTVRTAYRGTAGATAQAAVHGHRRRGAARQDEPAARAPLQVCAGGGGEGGGGGEDACRVGGRGPQRAAAEGGAGVRLEHDHTGHAVHGQPGALPARLHQQEALDRPRLAGHPRHTLRRLGAASTYYGHAYYVRLNSGLVAVT